jgi:RHS repeat-associated protein
MIEGGKTYRILTDGAGSVRLIVDSSNGSIAQRIDYDPWGNMLTDSRQGDASWYQPFGYAGGLADPRTGLVHFGARDYDPATGRWTAQDPLLFNGGQMNLYTYASDDPINLRDPLGLDGESAASAVPGTDGTTPAGASSWLGSTESWVSSHTDAIVSGAKSLAESGIEWAADKLGLSQYVDWFKEGKSDVDKAQAAAEEAERLNQDLQNRTPQNGEDVLKCGLDHLKQILPLDLIGIDAAKKIADEGVNQETQLSNHNQMGPGEHDQYQESLRLDP